MRPFFMRGGSSMRHGTSRPLRSCVRPRPLCAAASLLKWRPLHEHRPSSIVAEQSEGGRVWPALSTISTISVAALATIAVGFALYAASALLLPIASAFVVGVTLSPIARKLESARVPRAICAVLIVAGVTLVIALTIALIVPRVSELANGLPDLIEKWRD